MIKRGFIAVFAVFFCSGMLSAQVKRNAALPHVIVYKTKGNYRNKVSVILSADKTKVISYPAPQDIKTGGAFALPVLLHNGYLLDKRGISRNTAFTRYSFEEYNALTEVPSPEQFMNMLVDKNPLTALYDCGIRGKNNTEKELNELIDKKLLSKKCKVIK